MSYSNITDFLALIRQTSGGGRVESMPGLDYVVAAMSRMGMFSLSVGQTAPTVNQATTVWIKPAQPSWSAEGVVYLWNSFTAAYEIATLALWTTFLTTAQSGYNFQSAPSAVNAVLTLTSMVAIQRAAPVTTSLALPTVASRLGKALQIVDWSTGLAADHTITITPSGTDTIMKRPFWQAVSTPTQFAGLTLFPSTDLSAWVIAP